MKHVGETHKPKVLFAEDDVNMASMVQEHLCESGYDVIHVRDGQAALVELNATPYDLALLDIVLPKKDGLQLADIIRKHHRFLPLVFITARALVEDRVIGFKKGCDDYITKPFHFEELTLRLEAVLRRSVAEWGRNRAVSFHGLTFDMDQNQLSYGSQSLSLTPTESKIMGMLLNNFGQTVPRDVILEQVWGTSTLYTSRTLDVHMNRIRKLLKPFGNLVIQNSYSLGFKLRIVEPEGKNQELDQGNLK